MTRSALIVLFSISIILFLRCSVSDMAGGGTIETTNGISGSIFNGDNTPASNTIVHLFPEGYNPVADSALDEAYTATTDKEGFFCFNRICSGLYNIMARNGALSTSFLIRNIGVGDSVTTIAPATLDKPGLIIAEFATTVSFDSGSYIYIPGTDIFAYVRNDGKTYLDKVPSGVLPEIVLQTPGSEQCNILRNEITVLPEDTVSILNPLWKYACRLILNTCPTGAGVNSNHFNFPVLIRLNDSNFDFSQAQEDGADILFTASDNRLLPFEIERWDVRLGRAELWVKVDTIFGNDSTQFITMYWGNSKVTPGTHASAVFDTAEGFQGVWHLGDAFGSTFYDATANNYHGTSPDTSRPQSAEGIIGYSCVFDGASMYITMPSTSDGKLNFEQNGDYTISAWVLHDTFDGASHCILSKGYEQYYLRSTYISWQSPPPTTPLWEFVEFGETGETGTWRTSNFTVTEKQWSLLVGVRQGEKQLLYCNGVLVDSTVDVWENAVSRNTAHDLHIGRFAEAVLVPVREGYCYFKGSIDEVRIISEVRSPDWVRLCYMNQRGDDKLVLFR